MSCDTFNKTFWKNIILDVILVMLIWHRKKMYMLVGKTNFSFYLYWCLGLAIVLCWMGTFGEPVIDFRPFHPGINLAEGVLGQAEDDQAEDVTYTCIYELNGERHEFPLDSLPDEADGWEFIETVEHSAVAKEEAGSASINKVHYDFFARTPEGELFTEDLLTAPGYSILLLSPALKNASQHDIDKIERLYDRICRKCRAAR